jgi:hypothetical protein
MERFSRYGILIALALFAFLVPATLVSHSFWLSAGRSIYAKVRNGAVLAAARQPQP